MQITRTNYFNQSSSLFLTFFNQFYHPSIKSLSTSYSYGDYNEYQNSFGEIHYECLLQRLIITITLFALILIEAVIILCVILVIFLKYRVYYKYFWYGIWETANL